MKGTVNYIEEVISSSGNTYQKIVLQEQPSRKCISFEKEKFEVGKEYEFRVKENPDTSFILSLPKKTFNGFSNTKSIDINLECLKLAVGLVNESKVEIKNLESTAKRLKEIYDKL
jgi:hypothetical protein